MKKVIPYIQRYLWIGLLGIIVFLQVFQLNYFNFHIFDEIYYVKAAKELYHGQIDSNYQHPPFAKWLISVPMYFIGDSSSISWRLMSVVFSFASFVVLYVFARRVGLSRNVGLLLVLSTLLSGSWYVLSRVGMLDIFLCFFTLLHGFLVFLYLSKNQFATDFSHYKYHSLLVGSFVVLGLAGATKWSGFFPLVFVGGLFAFYWNMPIIRRVLLFGVLTFLSVVVYVVVSLSVYKLNTSLFIERNAGILLYHSQSMTPKSMLERADASGAAELRALGFGWQGVYNFMIHNHVYYFDEGRPVHLKRFGMSNNQLIAVSFMVVGLLIFLSSLGYMIRKIQKIPMEPPVFIRDPVILFTYLYSFVFFAVWALIPRLHYSFYYTPVFPFILLMAIYYLFKYTSVKYQIFYFIIYFGYSLYWLHLWIPF